LVEPSAVDQTFGIDGASGAVADEAFNSTVDASLHPCDGFTASVIDDVPVALLKIMENEGGPVS
jgi:hypothetical protein